MLVHSEHDLAERRTGYFSCMATCPLYLIIGRAAAVAAMAGLVLGYFEASNI